MMHSMTSRHSNIGTSPCKAGRLDASLEEDLIDDLIIAGFLSEEIRLLLIYCASKDILTAKLFSSTVDTHCVALTLIHR
jgi:hypothetical protein